MKHHLPPNKDGGQASHLISSKEKAMKYAFKARFIFEIVVRWFLPTRVFKSMNFCSTWGRSSLQIVASLTLLMAAHTASAQVNAAEYVDASMNELSQRQEIRFGSNPESPRNTSCWQWTTATVIDTSIGGAQLVGYMAVDDSGNIYVTWSGGLRSGGIGNVIQRSTDRGATWTRTDYGGTELSRTPKDIAVDHTGKVWLLWYSVQSEFSPTYINLSKSTDRGRTFNSVFRSRSYTSGSLYPKLAVDLNNSIYMLWDDAQFKLTKFRNGDVGQRTDALVPNDTLRVAFHPSIVVADDFRVHCLWEGGFNSPNTGLHRYIFSSSSTDSGLTFDNRIRVDTADFVDSSYVHHFPSATASRNGVLFVSYVRELMVNVRDTRFVQSNDRGATFTSPVVVADSTWYESHVSIDSCNRGVNILYEPGLGYGAQHRRSVDGGITFGEPISVGWWGFHSMASVFVNGAAYIYASGGPYSFFTRTDAITSAPSVATERVGFNLVQNYPNPFNSSTTVSYIVPVSARVRLEVLDLIGRRVAMLVDGAIDAGTYTTIWDATNFCSGVYFVRMETGEGLVKTIKLVLIR